MTQLSLLVISCLALGYGFLASRGRTRECLKVHMEVVRSDDPPASMPALDLHLLRIRTFTKLP